MLGGWGVSGRGSVGGVRGGGGRRWWGGHLFRGAGPHAIACGSLCSGEGGVGRREEGWAGGGGRGGE